MKTASGVRIAGLLAFRWEDAFHISVTTRALTGAAGAEERTRDMAI